MTVKEKEVLLDIYEDLAKEHGWPWHSGSRQWYEDHETLPWWVAEQVEQFGKDHPKFSLIAKIFCNPVEEPSDVDCHNRRDWWTAFVNMLDDAKRFLSEEDRKELYQDLQCLIGHRLHRKEY